MTDVRDTRTASTESRQRITLDGVYDAVLAQHVRYDMHARTHLALAMDSPMPRHVLVRTAGRTVVTAEVGGLHQSTTASPRSHGQPPARTPVVATASLWSARTRHDAYDRPALRARHFPLVMRGLERPRSD